MAIRPVLLSDIIITDNVNDYLLDVELVRHEHGLLYIYLIFLPISVHCTAPHISAYYHNTEM